MANNFSSATLGLGVDTTQFNKDIGNTGYDTRKILESMKLSADAFNESWKNMTSGIKDTKRIVSGILVSQGFYALINVLTEGAAAALDFSKNMETAAISMEYFTTGANKAAKAQAFLRTMNEFAARTPFSTTEAIGLSKYMQAVGVAMGTTKSFLQVITDTAAATGATEENLQRIVFGLGQMMTKGRLANEEIRQLANANIPIYEILQEELGLTGKQISQIGKNWVSADIAVTAILTGLEKRYQGASDRIAQTVTGMTDTILDNAKIIGQVTFGSFYDRLSEGMGTLRDTLDLWRAIASEGVYINKAGKVVSEAVAASSREIESYYAGSAGLFNYILKQIDSTGQLGTEILALIGNTKQLGAALRDLYIAGKPLIGLFGQSLYATITTLEISLTAMSRVVEGVIEGLDKLGITGGDAGQVIASLFIAYKAAKWMSFLGQSVTAAGYAMYQTISTASAMLPSFVQMSVGAKLATTSIIGLGLSLLSAYGIFKMVNNAMAGLDTTTSGDNLFPDDYEEAYAKYEEAMKAYNAQIAKYEEDYNAPFTTIDDGSDKAVESLEDIAKASKKSAAAVKKDWIAAFDEVYSIPDNTSDLDDVVDTLEDLGALLNLNSFKFPSIPDTIQLEVPKLEDFYKGGLLEDLKDNDVLDANWWKALLPWVILGGIKGLGDMFAKNKAAKNGTPGLGKGTGEGTGPTGGSVFQNTKEAAATLKQMAKEVGTMEKVVSDTLATIKSGKVKTKPELEVLYKKLELQNTALLKYIDKVNTQAIIAGSPSTLNSSVALEARVATLQHLIEGNVERYKELQVIANDIGKNGESAKAELVKLNKELSNQYEEFRLIAGDAVKGVEASLKGIINTKGLEGRIDNLISTTEEIRAELALNSGNTLNMADKISDMFKLSKDIVKELKAIGNTTVDIAEPVKLIEDIHKLYRTQIMKATALSEIDKIKEIIATFDARKSLGLGVTQETLQASLKRLNTTLETLIKNEEIRKSMISTDTAGGIEALKQQQILQRHINRFTSIVKDSLDRFSGEILKPLKAIERYAAKITLESTTGTELLSNAATRAEELAKRLSGEGEVGLSSVFNDIATLYREALKTRTKPSETLPGIQSKLLTELNNLSKQWNLSAEITEPLLAQIAKKLESIDSKFPALDLVVKQNAENRAAARARRASEKSLDRPALEVIENKLEAIRRSAASIADFDKGTKELVSTIKDRFPDFYTNNNKQLLEAIAEARKDTISQIELLHRTTTAAEQMSRDMLSHNQAQKLIDEILAKIPNRSGRVPGINSNAAFLNEPVGGEPYALNIKAGFVDADIVRANLFNPKRVAASGTDIAGLLGDSDYGTTPQSSAAGNLQPGVATQLGILSELKTIRTIGNMMFGQIAEAPIGFAAMQKLAEHGIEVTKGGFYFNQDRTLQAQFDYFLKQNGKFKAPLDAKAFASFENKLLPMLQEYATYEDGIWTVPKSKFYELVKAANDTAYQAALQATIMKTSEAWLAVLNPKAVGIQGPDLTGLSTFNTAVPKDVKYLESIFKKQALDQYIPALDAINNSINLIRVEVPNSIKTVIKQAGRGFIDYQKLISQYFLRGGLAGDLFVPLNTFGEKIGTLTSERYLSQQYTPPLTGDKALSDYLAEITTDIKNTNAEIRAYGLSKLDNMIELLEESKGSDATGAIERQITLGRANNGSLVQIEISTRKLTELVPALKEFRTSFESRATSITIQLSDLVKQMNRAAEKGLKANDTVYIRASDGKPITVADLAWQIKAADKALTGGSNISTQMLDIANGAGVAQTVANPYGFGDLAIALTQTTNSLSTLINKDEQLRLGGNIQFVNSLEEMLANAAKSGKMGVYTGPSGTTFASQADGALAKLLEKLNIKYGSYSTYAGTEGAAAAAPSSAGTWFNAAGKNLKISSSTMSGVIGGLGVGLAIYDIIKQTGNTMEDFQQSILPLINENERAAAQERANKMGITGWTTGANAGQLPEKFLSQYAEMTEAERMYWGQVATRSENDIFGVSSDRDLIGALTNTGVLRAVLAGINIKEMAGIFGSTTQVLEPSKVVLDQGSPSTQMEYGMVDPRNYYVTGSPEAVLASAMADGIENSSLAALTDYIIRSGDTSSTIAKEFYKRYGDYIQTIVAPAYGIDAGFTKELQTLLDSTDTSIQEFAKQAGISADNITDVPINMQIILAKYISQMQDNLEAAILPTLEAQEKYNTGDNPLVTDYTRIVGDIDFSTMSDAAAEEIKKVLGISFESISDTLSTIKIDSSEISDNVLGWTTRLPETIKLDGTTLSVQDVAILASAGIQINGDGTVTFMKAMNMNTTGTERDVELTIADVSKNVTDALAKSGLSFDFSGGEAELNLSLDKLRKTMSSALFQLDQDYSGQLSADMETALKGLGTVMDSGYFNITNNAVLSGKMTIAEYLKGMGKSIDELSPELQASLLKIDDMIAASGQVTGSSLIETKFMPLLSQLKFDKPKKDTAAFNWVEFFGTEEGLATLKATLLTGETTVEEYLATIGVDIDKQTPAVKQALILLNQELVNGIQLTDKAVIESASGISLPSPIDADALTEEMKLAFSKVGVSFVQQGEEFLMVINKVGEQVQDGVTLVPSATWDKVNDDVVTALEALGVKITPTAAGVMVDVSDTMESNVGEIIKLFTDRPDLWDQIPTSITEQLAKAGISVENGMLVVNTDMMNGLVNLGNQWYTKWDALPQDVQDALGAAKLEAGNGLLTIEKITEDTTIPDNVNEYIIKPFDELPEEIQNRLTGGDASVKKSLEGSQMLLKGATETAFVGAVTAVQTSFDSMNQTASEGAAELANTVAAAIASAQALNNIQIRTTWNPFDNDSQVIVTGTPGNYTVRYGGVEYSGINAKTQAEAVKLVEARTGLDLPGYKLGGLVDKEGIYRLAEGNKQEGIIPLKNKAGLSVIGNAIANQMSYSPVQQTKLQNARSLSNGGLVYQTAAEMLPSMYPQMYSPNQGVPSISNNGPVTDNTKPTVFVQYLIADDRGLRELERRMHVVRLEENARRSGS